MGKYCSLVSQGNAPFVAIPVFPSRVPRTRRSMFIARAGEEAEDLAGKRIGIPEWAQTASVYSRGSCSTSTASTSPRSTGFRLRRSAGRMEK